MAEIHVVDPIKEQNQGGHGSQEAESEQRSEGDNNESQQAIDDIDSADGSEHVVSRPQYLVDLDRAEEAERRLASGEGLQGIDGDAEAPSDPIDSLR